MEYQKAKIIDSFNNNLGVKRIMGSTISNEGLQEVIIDIFGDETTLIPMRVINEVDIVSYDDRFTGKLINN